MSHSRHFHVFVASGIFPSDRRRWGGTRTFYGLTRTNSNCEIGRCRLKKWHQSDHSACQSSEEASSAAQLGVLLPIRSHWLDRWDDSLAAVPRPITRTCRTGFIRSCARTAGDFFRGRFPQPKWSRERCSHHGQRPAIFRREIGAQDGPSPCAAGHRYSGL